MLLYNNYNLEGFVMKLVIQRVNSAEVAVDDKTVGAIKQGLMVLVGVSKDDD